MIHIGPDRQQNDEFSVYITYWLKHKPKTLLKFLFFQVGVILECQEVKTT